jgi:hypothetical protein
MDHCDAEVTDVVVVLQEDPGMTVENAVLKLQTEGLSVSDIDQGNSVVEGTILSEKVKGLEKLPFVKYVRNVFSYTADYLPGDPRNLDTDNDADPESTDDAGA